MKKCILFIVSFFLIINVCNAEIKTYDRNNLENYGVNKDIKITNKNKDNIMNAYAVNSEQKIYDFADILSDEYEEELYDTSIDFYKNTGFELIVLTDSFYNYSDVDNEAFVQDFYDYNDFGLDDEYYSGVVIFRNNYDGLPYYGIYTFGEAQLYFSNDRVNNILDLIFNDMKSANYKNAFNTVISELNDYYEHGISSKYKNYYIDENGMMVEKYQPPILAALIIATIGTILIIGILVSKNKMIKKATTAADYLNKNSIYYSVNEDKFINSHTTSYVRPRDTGGSSDGGSHVGSSGRGSGGGGRRG